MSGLDTAWVKEMPLRMLVGSPGFSEEPLDAAILVDVDSFRRGFAR